MADLIPGASLGSKLPRPEGEKEKGSPFVTHEAFRGNLGTQKKVLGRVIGVEKRVDNAEKKITLLKNILKMRQQSDGKNKIGDTISGIAASVESISQTVEDQNEFEQDKLEDERIEKEQKGRKKREGFIEKMGGGIKKIAQKAIAPIQSVFERIWNFIKIFALGAGVLKLIDWFSDKNNHKKVQSLIRFFKDWWPALLAGLIAFFPALLGPAGVILGIIALAAWGIPKIIAAVKSIFGMNKDVEKITADNTKDVDKEVEEGDIDEKEMDKMFASGQQETQQPDVTPPDQTQPEQPPQEEPLQMFNEGGLVQGPGGVDKVPAKLTSGEFVMSKGAVEQYGANTLAGMNAAAGGTNIPSRSSRDPGFNGGGFVLNKSSYSNNNTLDVRPTQKILPYEGKEYHKKFQFGGKVTGPGGEDKVPAKLTAGEFVMNRSAVKTFGENTFASMNASAGGSNVPVEHHYHSGGSGVEKHFAGGGLVQPTGNNDNVVPPGTPTITAQTVHLVPTDAGSSAGPSGSPQGTGSKVPSFSAIAPGGVAKEQVLGIRR